MTNESSQAIYVTGATGYIGGRLVPRLLDAGYTVRCLTRSVAQAAGASVGRPRASAGGRRRRHGASAAHGRPARLPRRVLPDSFDGDRRVGICRARSAPGDEFRSGLRRWRGRAHPLPGRPGGDGRPPFGAPVVSPRGGRGPGVDLGAGHHAAGRDDPRLRVGFVRDPALPHRALAGDGDTALGEHGKPAHLHPRRPRLSHGLPPERRDHGADDRHRWSGRRHLPRTDADDGGGARPSATGDSARSAPDATSQFGLDPSGDSALPPHCSAAGRGLEKSRGGT